MSNYNNNTETLCEICNTIIYEDGTVENCMGECGRELNIEQDYVPLSFDEEGVLRELPEPFPYDELEDNGAVDYD